MSSSISEKKTISAKRSLKKNVSPTEFAGPSRPKSGYFLFADEHRAAVIAQLREEAEKGGSPFKVTAVSRKISELYKAASDETKAELNEKSKKLRETYVEAEKAWKESDDYKAFLMEKADHGKKRAEGKARDEAKAAGMPKKSMTSWMLFNQDFLAELKAKTPEGQSLGQIADRAVVAKAKWAALSEDEKKGYAEKAKTLKEKYDEEMKAFKESEAGQSFEKKMNKARADKAKAVKTPMKRAAKSSEEPKTKRVKVEEEKVAEVVVQETEAAVQETEAAVQETEVAVQETEATVQETEVAEEAAPMEAEATA